MHHSRQFIPAEVLFFGAAHLEGSRDDLGRIQRQILTSYVREKHNCRDQAFTLTMLSWSLALRLKLALSYKRRCALRLHPWLQLPSILGSVEVALRGGNQAVVVHAPNFETADPHLVTSSSRPRIRAGESPVVLEHIRPY